VDAPNSFGTSPPQSPHRRVAALEHRPCIGGSRRSLISDSQSSKNSRSRRKTFTKLRQVDVLVSQGQNASDAIRPIGVSEVTYYRWRHVAGYAPNGFWLPEPHFVAGGAGAKPNRQYRRLEKQVATTTEGSKAVAVAPFAQSS
jgi:hypothetical protein